MLNQHFWNEVRNTLKMFWMIPGCTVVQLVEALWYKPEVDSIPDGVSGIFC
jgi:hypothetical protein